MDLNCDLGESFGNYLIGQDELVFPYITSANIACGYHGGDAYHIEKTIDAALEHGVQIGAHPGYPDLQGFGRRKMQIPLDELSSMIKYQVGALQALVISKGAQLKYVKPHGALYNSMVNNLEEARVVVQSIKSMDSDLRVMGLAGSQIETICKDLQMGFVAEAFADRRYTRAGQLVSRSLPDAVIREPAQAARQVLEITRDHSIKTIDDHRINIQAQSVCIHGDNSKVSEILQSIHELMRENHISIQAF